MSKINKGEFAWLSGRKKREIIKTVLYFGISAALFLMGWLSTKTTANLLTIVAVLGCLPASKSAVSMIMFLRVKGCSKETEVQLRERFGEDFGCFNLYFTSDKKNYEIHHLFVNKSSIAAYTEDEKTKSGDFEEHIQTMLRQAGVTKAGVKLYKDRQKYMERLEQLILLEADRVNDEKILTCLYSVSL